MLFSIIMPVYNGERFLREALDSVLAQTFSDFEAIVVNDGPTDSSAGILDEYASKDERFKVVHKENGGLVHARKTGAEISSGEYIVILDCDDMLAADALEKYAAVISRVKPDVCYCGQIRCENGKEIPIPIKMPDGSQGLFSREEIDKMLMPTLLRFRPTVWGSCMRRELYMKHQIQVDNRIFVGEDGAVTFPLIADASSIYLMPDNLYYYRIHSGSAIHASRKLYAWENTALRLARYESSLPMDRFGLRSQVDCFAVTAYFRVALSRYRNTKYVEASRYVQEFLAVPEVQAYFKKIPDTKRREVKIAYVLLHFRLLPLLKFYLVFEKAKKILKKK